jgi:hypothetical protein
MSNRTQWASTFLLAYLVAATSAAQSPLPLVDSFCPSGYSKSAKMCIPGSDARPGIVKQGFCPNGYEANGRHYCLQAVKGAASGAAVASSSDDIHDPKATYQGAAVKATLRKADRFDMCPGGFRTDNTTKGYWCVSTLAAPTTVRMKNGANCKEGEVADYDKYCVSNITAPYASLRGHYTADFNSMYAIHAVRQSQGGPKLQHNFPDDEPSSLLFAKNRDESQKAVASPGAAPN